MLANLEMSLEHANANQDTQRALKKYLEVKYRETQVKLEDGFPKSAAGDALVNASAVPMPTKMLSRRSSHPA